MKIARSVIVSCATVAVFAALALFANRAFAHCDGMDGPVVHAAQTALESGDASPALAWVKRGDEALVRAAFQQTLEVRKLSPEARELADRAFFETLVRLHRAGEGAPYTGLKPAGRDLGPAIPLADRSLETGDVEALVKLVNDATAAGIRERFQRARTLKTYDAKNVEAGREFVEAYVTYLHYVEGCYRASQKPAHGADSELHPGDEHED